MFVEVKKLFLRLQREICDELERIECSASKFITDEWSKEDGFGCGVSRVLKGTRVFEQAGVNWSQVYASQLPPTILAKYPNLRGKKFFVTGISLVIHPISPLCPTVHANYRFFQVMKSDEEYHDSDGVIHWWFGGGMDLTPYYLYPEDAFHFHSSLKAICDRHDKQFFTVYSEWANKYFYLKHRKEHRGIGGLFFDYLSADTDTMPLYRVNEDSFEYSADLKALSERLFSQRDTSARALGFTEILKFVKECGEGFIPVYCTLITRRKEIAYTERERQWQLYRRGRYVEFNLLYDRGTVFGLQTGGRVESILMSLPPLVRYEYNYSPEKDSPEDKLMKVLKKPVQWEFQE